MAAHSSFFQLSDPAIHGKFSAAYPSHLTVLIVGDGNLGFSSFLVESRQDGSKIMATSFQTYDGVTAMYKKARKHINNLRKRGAVVLFKVDARTMGNDPRFTGKLFDRIIFNFPHAGFDGRAETNKGLIEKHRALVRCFFKNAATMLTTEGEVHVTHKTNKPYDSWNLPELANEAGLEHLDTCAFDIKDYPGYENKKGDGPDADKRFKLGKCAKFKFRKIK